MPYPSMQSAAQRVRRVAITIPGSAATAVTLESLVTAALDAIEVGWSSKNLAYIMGGSISGPSATYTAGDSPTSLPVTVAINAIYAEPSLDFLKATYVKATGVGTVAVVASVYLSGT